MPNSVRLATCVVGAGPAGLLFCLVGRILEPDPDRWSIMLCDKRSSYERTHRLRMDPAPFHLIRAKLASPRFDRFIEFLIREDFRPTAKQLEEYLATDVSDLGIERRLLTVGDGPGELGLEDLFELLSAIAPGANSATIVGSDSVRSSVRMLLGADVDVVSERHQQVARLKLEGNDLPHRLGRIEQFKLAKLLGSVLDYRLNPNGYAEVDLFLAGEEHDTVSTLGAVPARPVHLSTAKLEELDLPFFTTVVSHLVGPQPSERQALLMSTFRLEHQYSPHVSFPGQSGTVFLVGDAAISLPFFRGMASLGANVAGLAEAHRAMLDGVPAEVAAARYDAHAAAVATREIQIVRQRNRLVQVAHEVVSMSAVVPFPIQSWFLSAEVEEPGDGAWTGAVLVNATLALVAGVIAIAAPLVGAYVAAPLGWLWLAALPIQTLGGYAFETARRLDPTPNPRLATVWRIQLAALIVAAIPLTVVSSRALGRPGQLYALVAWFVLGVVFAVGMRVAGRRRL